MRPDDALEIRPSLPVRGVVRVPGSKSHTNRSLVIAALSEGRSTLRGALLADDTLAMLEGLRSLGFRADSDERSLTMEVEGCSGSVPARGGRVEARDAGTVMRFLTAVAALGEGVFTIDGSPRMRERPIGDLVEGLRSLGVEARCELREGYPPVQVRARGLAGGRARVSAAVSSQFVSALLLVSPCARGTVELELEGAVVSEGFIELTLSLMREFGAAVERPRAGLFRIAGGRPYRAGVHEIEGDATAASYFWAAAAITGGRVTVENVGPSSRQGDAAFVEVLERMGCRVERSGGGLTVESTGRLVGGSFDLNSMPDTVPTCAVVALFAEGPTEIGNVANLRVKECDRLSALARELSKLGARVEERPDGLKITPPPGGARALRGARVSTYRDHRMAMSLSLAGLVVPGVLVEDPRCVGKTYPAFFEDLFRIARPR